jgi:hypothetical protein
MSLRKLWLPKHFNAKAGAVGYEQYLFAAVAQFPQNRSFTTITPNLEKEIQMYSSRKQTPVSLKSLMETGQGNRLQEFDELMKLKYDKEQQQTPQASQRILIQVACFLHRELPIRLAQRAIKLESSPLFIRSGEFLLFFSLLDSS